MKKFITILVLGFLFFSDANTEERKDELDKLFTQLKNTKNLSSAKILENKIWKIWSTHPSNDRQGFRLTELLDLGSLLIDKEELDKAYEIFSNIILVDPSWAEAWNQRALVLYLMKRYQSSLDDINITLSLEPRHFGALSGQALNYIELKQYEKAIKSYKATQKIYPINEAAKKMIRQLQELIDDQVV